MIRILKVLVSFFMCMSLKAQPYIDIVSVKYLNSPNASLSPRNNTINHFQYFNFGATVPFILKKDSSIIAFSPFAEQWKIKISTAGELPANINSLAIPISFIKPVSKKWNITTIMIPRWNGDKQSVFSNHFQIGAALLAAYKKSQQLTWKFGLYYNSELFGPFFIPLLGIDWRINNSNNLFGVLPGNLTFEHKQSDRFYYGANFKSITNSYDAGFTNAGTTARYLRIDDNQLSLFADLYLLKKLVLTFEGGHSILRKLRLGMRDAATKYYYKEKMNDDILIKVSLNYRLRF